jgi:hypothetical protein
MSIRTAALVAIGCIVTAFVLNQLGSFVVFGQAAGGPNHIFVIRIWGFVTSAIFNGGLLIFLGVVASHSPDE